MKGIRIILICVFTSGTSLFCSASSLGWGVTTFSQDTLFLDDTLRIHTSLKNYDSLDFNDTTIICLAINSIRNINKNLFPNPFPNQPLQIAGYDSIAIDFIIVINSAYFEVGPDILVVWPKVIDGSYAHDSIIKTIYVLDPRYIGMDDEISKRLKAFYFGGDIIIQTEGLEMTLNRVRIFNLNGQEIFSAPLNDNHPIPFNSSPNGIYFVEINFKSTERRILKIAKF